MKDTYIEDKTFKKIDFTKSSLEKAEYNYCKFIDCNFENLKLSDFKFIECEFTNCNLSNVKTANTAFQEIVFDNCKILGVHFEDCNKFLLSFSFKKCQLNLSSFYSLNIKNTKFTNCNLQDVDFTETELSSSLFDNCDLVNSIFENTILEKCDFTTSFNYIINPEINKIKKAKFSKDGLAGLLNNYDIVICN